MDAIAPAFRVQSQGELRAITGETWASWSLDPVHMLLHHRPRRLMFSVVVNPELFQRGVAKAPDIELRLIHLCDGATMPTASELARVAVEGMQVVLLEQPFEPAAGGSSGDLADDQIPF